MNNFEVAPVTGIEVIPTKGGIAIFLITESKTIFFQVDSSLGETLQKALAGSVQDRPMSHDLMLHMLQSLDSILIHVVIVDIKDNVFFARIIIGQEGPVAKKIAEVDARPSDAIILAVKSKRPVFIAKSVLDACENMSEMLSKLRKNV